MIQEIDGQSFDQNDVLEGIAISINKHIHGEIDKIIDSIAAIHDRENLGEKPFIQNELAVGLDNESTRNFENLPQSPGNSELTTPINQAIGTPNLPHKDAASKSYTEDEVDDNNFDKLVEDDYINETFELLAEESSDENDKKVKFSEIEMGNKSFFIFFYLARHSNIYFLRLYVGTTKDMP